MYSLSFKYTCPIIDKGIASLEEGLYDPLDELVEEINPKLKELLEHNQCCTDKTSAERDCKYLGG